LILDKIRHVIARKVTDPQQVETVVDVLIWTGCIGALSANGPIYISDCGFKRQFLRALIQGDDKYVVFHPTLSSIFATPATASIQTSALRRSIVDTGQGDLLE
jgi:hypothetical protein